MEIDGKSAFISVPYYGKPFGRGGKAGKISSIIRGHPVVKKRSKVTFVTSNKRMQGKPQLVVAFMGVLAGDFTEQVPTAPPACSVSTDGNVKWAVSTLIENKEIFTRKWILYSLFSGNACENHWEVFAIWPTIGWQGVSQPIHGRSSMHSYYSTVALFL